MSGYTAKAVRASKQHRCDDARECPPIKVGDVHVRSVLFPGDITDAIWTHRLCASCAERYVETRGLVVNYGAKAVPDAR